MVPAGRNNTPVANLIPALLRLGHRVSVVAAERTVSQTVHVHGPNLNIIVVPHRPSLTLAMLDSFRVERRRLLDVIRDLKPNLVHGHWTQTGHASAALDSGYPCVNTIHDAALTCAWLSRGYRPDRILFIIKQMAETRTIARRSRYIIAVSPYVEAHFRRYFGYRGDARVIPNAVPDALLDGPGEPLRTFDAGLATFASNGDWGRLKNIANLLRAFALVIRAQPSARLILIGAGLGSGGPAQAWAQRHHVAQRVTFAGVLDYAAVQRTLKNEVDILVHPSRTEACSMAIAEALALGIPVIAGPVGGIPWMTKQGACGCLVDIEDPKAIAAAMLRLANDADLRRMLAEAGVAWAGQCFKADRVAQQHIEYYQHALDQYQESHTSFKRIIS